jgi:hypothetical protein
VLLGRFGQVQSIGARLLVVDTADIYTAICDQAKHVQLLAAVPKRVCDLLGE